MFPESIFFQKVYFSPKCCFGHVYCNWNNPGGKFCRHESVTLSTKSEKKFWKNIFFQKQIPSSKIFSRNVECSYDNSAEMLPPGTQFLLLNFRKFKHKFFRGKHVFWSVPLDTMDAPLSKLTNFFERVWNCFADGRKLLFDSFSQKVNFILTRWSGQADSTCDKPAEGFLLENLFIPARSPKKEPNFEVFPKKCFKISPLI